MAWSDNVSNPERNNPFISEMNEGYQRYAEEHPEVRTRRDATASAAITPRKPMQGLEPAMKSVVADLEYIRRLVDPEKGMEWTLQQNAAHIQGASLTSHQHIFTLRVDESSGESKAKLYYRNQRSPHGMSDEVTNDSDKSRDRDSTDKKLRLLARLMGEKGFANPSLFERPQAIGVAASYTVKSR